MGSKTNTLGVEKTIEQIAIIGGEGKFGKFAGELISKTGIKVVNIIETTSEEEKKDIIDNSQVVIFSVPISQTVEIIKSNAKHLIGDKLVMDITGIKSPAMEELRKLNVSEIVGTHPMFGPFGNSVVGRKVIFSEEKTGKKWKFIRRFLKEAGANLIELSPEEHDEKMALIQALTHLTNMIFINTIKDLGFHPEELEQLETPIYKLQALISGRFLSQSGALYADMQMENPIFLEKVLPALNNSLSQIGGIDLGGNKESFVKLFDELSNFLGEEFKGKSIDDTKKIDEALK